MIGDLWKEFRDATMLLVAMHGMGPNDSDVPAMALLPELLHRFAFRIVLHAPHSISRRSCRTAPLFSRKTLTGTISFWKPFRSTALQRMPDASARVANLDRACGISSQSPRPSAQITWMPAARYSHFWPRMKAFALPSYYDGRIRLNVIGREAKGIIEPHQYETVCQQIAEIISDCRNLQTGGRVVREIYAPKKNFNDVGPTEADLYVIWEGAPLGFASPQLGTIGPVPYRRTGGHTGQHGFLSIVSDDLPAGHYGVASSFDVVPTLIHLLGETQGHGISGKPLVPRRRSRLMHVTPPGPRP